MSTPVKINVKTTINEQETFELVVFGQYDQKEHSSYLRYEEVLEEGSVRTIVKTTDDEVLILRSGAVKMRLPFQLHKKMKGSFETPLGRFDTTTTAQRLQHGKGMIDILYDFSLQGSHAGTYHMEISFQEDKI
ncbi:DUF1934 domain-containing protein [Neobacillus massiliamazoniensis]|uniref:DUF1934 domain-containing protein n=1 Tax=Neobacillus massiliamazoniensis TaxID=1499688 RepID=A0A0U1NXA1_9BACI|nr:DUF1934 domain-containing protein [Neobacillus massiliamazoniensis]CRK82596.1 Hypothetical protein BN000_02529 [Neobacillus massiliamazoniensis]